MAIGDWLVKQFSMRYDHYMGRRSYMLPLSSRDFRGLVGDGSSSDIVMACINWMMTTFPEAPIVLRRKDSHRIMIDHALHQLLQKPNRSYSAEILWMVTLWSFCIDGNAYWLKAGPGPDELWWAPHWLIEPKGDDTNFIKYYSYTVNGREYKLPPEDVIHFRFGLDPQNYRLGLSPIKTAFREIFTDAQAATWTAALLHNKAVPGLIVTPAGNNVASQDDIEATKKRFQEDFTGDNIGEPIVMRGQTQVVEFGFSPRQMNLRDIRRMPEERVSGLLTLPAIVAGLGAGLDRSTFANMKEAREMAYELNIIPKQRNFSTTLELQLLPDYTRNSSLFELPFDLSNVRILQPDEDKKATRLVSLYQGGLIKRGEGREALSYDTTDEDDVYYTDLEGTLNQSPDPEAAVSSATNPRDQGDPEDADRPPTRPTVNGD